MALPSNVILNIPIVASLVAEAPLTTENNQFDIGISFIAFDCLLTHNRDHHDMLFAKIDNSSVDYSGKIL